MIAGSAGTFISFLVGPGFWNQRNHGNPLFGKWRILSALDDRFFYLFSVFPGRVVWRMMLGFKKFALNIPF